jgi:putative membrane protein
MKTLSKYFPHILLGAYIIEFFVLAIGPTDRAVWWTENLTVMPIAVILVVLYMRGVRFSNISYALMSVLLYMHTYGGHYTFALAPFDWFNTMFGFERNMYDRVAHMTVGFYAYPIIEATLRYKVVTRKWFAYLAAFAIIPAIAALYEIFEWQYAISADPTAGIAVLGSQGDIWDAQKDMLMDSLGGVIAVALYIVRDTLKSTSSSTSNS